MSNMVSFMVGAQETFIEWMNLALYKTKQLYTIVCVRQIIKWVTFVVGTLMLSFCPPFCSSGPVFLDLPYTDPDSSGRGTHVSKFICNLY